MRWHRAPAGQAPHQIPIREKKPALYQKWEITPRRGGGPVQPAKLGAHFAFHQ
jgi:hypothetical protein